MRRLLPPLLLASFGALAASGQMPAWTCPIAIASAAALGELCSRERRSIERGASRAMPAVVACAAGLGLGRDVGAMTSAAVALACGAAWIVSELAAPRWRATIVPGVLLGLAAASTSLGWMVGGGGAVAAAPFLLVAFAAAACTSTRWSDRAARAHGGDAERGAARHEPQSAAADRGAHVGRDAESRVGLAEPSAPGWPDRGDLLHARIALAADVGFSLAAAIAGGATRSGLALLAAWLLAELAIGAIRTTGGWMQRLSIAAFVVPAFGAWLVVSAIPRDAWGVVAAILGAQALVVGAGALACVAGRRRVVPISALRVASRASLVVASLAVPGACVVGATLLEPALRVAPTEWRELAPGVEVLVRDLPPSPEGPGAATSRPSTRAVVARIDLAHPETELFATPIAFPRPMDPFELRFVAEVASSEDLVVATNGPLFAGTFGSAPLPGMPFRTTEAMVVDGRATSVTPITYLFWTDDARRLHVERAKPPSAEALAAARWGVGVQQVPLRDGEIPGYYRAAPHPHVEVTVIGSDATGRFLYLARFDVVDPVVALEFLAGLGVAHAGQLDGGSASGIALRDPATTTLRVAGGIRPVAVTIGVRRRSTGPGERVGAAPDATEPLGR